MRVTQPDDQTLDCTALKQQIADNRAAAEKLLQKDKTVEDANTAKTIGGVIPLLGLLLVGSTDLSNEEQVKARALIDRDEWLTYLAKQKRCGE